MKDVTIDIKSASFPDQFIVDFTINGLNLIDYDYIQEGSSQ